MTSAHRVRPSTVLIMTLLVVLFSASVVDACPSCKAGMEHGQSNLARGYFWSILFMMSMPFLIFGGLGSYFYLLIRKARLQQVETVQYTHVANQSVHDAATPHELAYETQQEEWPQDPVEF